MIQHRQGHNRNERCKPNTAGPRTALNKASMVIDHVDASSQPYCLGLGSGLHHLKREVWGEHFAGTLWLASGYLCLSTIMFILPEQLQITTPNKHQTFRLSRNTSSLSTPPPPSPPPRLYVWVVRTGDAPPPTGLLKSGWGSGTSNLCGVLRREFLRPVDEGGGAGVPPFWRGVLGGRVLSKNSGERGTPKWTRFFLDKDETSPSPGSPETLQLVYYWFSCMTEV